MCTVFFSYLTFEYLWLDTMEDFFQACPYSNFLPFFHKVSINFVIMIPLWNIFSLHDTHSYCIALHLGNFLSAEPPSVYGSPIHIYFLKSMHSMLMKKDIISYVTIVYLHTEIYFFLFNSGFNNTPYSNPCIALILYPKVNYSFALVIYL